MDIHEIGNLLERIMVHYPAFEKQVIKDGKLSRAVGEEWHRLIGFLDYDEALARLDAYMEDPDNKRPPMAMDFKRVKPRKNSEIFHAPIEHEWIIVNGRLYDEEDREYVIDPTNELPFYYDKEGNICQGKIIRFYHQMRYGRSTTERMRVDMSEDVISRRDAIDALDKDPMGGLNYNRILNDLPSAQKTGRWVRTRTMEHDGELYCNLCGQEHPEQKIIWNYCPSCGAKMEV